MECGSVFEWIFRIGQPRKFCCVGCRERYNHHQAQLRRAESGGENGWWKHVKMRVRASRNRAKERGLTHTITVGEILGRLWDQEGRCALTGVTMTCLLPLGTRRGLTCPTTISIDRIDPNRGYVLDNVRLVCWFANRARGELADDTFFDWCARVVRHNGVQA